MREVQGLSSGGGKSEELASHGRIATAGNFSKSLLLVQAMAADTALHIAALEMVGFKVTVLGAGDRLAEIVERGRPSAVVIDLAIGGMDAFDLLGAIHALEPPVVIIAVTADHSLNASIRAIRAGARDCLVKPFKPERLVSVVQRALGAASSEVAAELRHPTATVSRRPDGFIGSSPQMQSIYRVLETAAASNAAVFISGESGTGKEICAQAIHRASARHNRPFVAINCSAMPRDLVETELFGHMKGAFTGAMSNRAGAALQAHGGTLFLDEICEMDIALQAKLLRFLQMGAIQRVGSSAAESVDVRIICATNRDPLVETAAGRFREDLYYRLHVVPIHLPPLRERGADILEIARSLLVEIALEEGRPVKRLAPSAEAAIARYRWPGNVRQLQNVLRSMVLLNNEEELTANMLPEPITSTAVRAPRKEEVWRIAPGNQRPVEPLWLVEKRAIEYAIRLFEDNIARAAAALEISPSTVYRKRQAWSAEGRAFTVTEELNA